MPNGEVRDCLQEISLEWCKRMAGLGLPLDLELIIFGILCLNAHKAWTLHIRLWSDRRASLMRHNGKIFAHYLHRLEMKEANSWYVMCLADRVNSPLLHAKL